MGQETETAPGGRRAKLIISDLPGFKYKIHEKLEDRLFEIGKLSQHPDNPRSNDPAKLSYSLDTHGQYRAIVVNIGSFSERYEAYTILAGNHTYQGALGLDWTHIAVELVDVDDDEADEILLIDNKYGDDAWTDEAAALKIMERLEDPERAGYSKEMVQAMWARQNQEDEEIGEEFDDVDPNMDTKHTCPQCGYSWG